MKYCFVLFFLAAVIACGGVVEESPEPMPPVGPGFATAFDGTQIAYTVTGSGSRALVFIHGWMCDQGFWAAQVEPFAQNHTVVTIDLAGHGASGQEREGWPLLAFGDDVAAVVESLNLKEVILIGHSMGGPVALEAARLMPERIVAVVGADTLHDADLKYDPEMMAPFIAAMKADFPATCGNFVTSMFPESADPALVERVNTEMCSGSAEIGATLMRNFIDYDAAAAMSSVPADIPVRSINASTNPTNLEGNRAYHQDFDVITIEGVGHFLMMEKPEEFNAELAGLITEFSHGGSQPQ